jgi:hypothetical protein
MPVECLPVLAGIIGYRNSFLSSLFVLLIVIAMGSINLRTSSHFE